MFEGLRKSFTTPMNTQGSSDDMYSTAGNSPTQFVKPEQVYDDYYDPESTPAAYTSPAGEIYAGNSVQWSTEFADAMPSIFDSRAPIIADNTAYQTPAAGSQNLNDVLERTGGEVVGRQATFRPVGPVTGLSTPWTGLAGSIPTTLQANYKGPVGQNKYSDQAAMALAQANQQTINDAVVAAGLVAAI